MQLANDFMLTRRLAIAALACGLRCLTPQIAWAAEEKPVTFEVYIAEREAGAGLKEARVEGTQDQRVYLHEKPVLTREDVAEAHAGLDYRGKPAIDVTLNKAGRAKLGKATGESIDKQLAIVVGGKVLSTATIKAKVADGVQIVGTYSKAAAEKLATEICPPERKSP